MRWPQWIHKLTAVMHIAESSTSVGEHFARIEVGRRAPPHSRSSGTQKLLHACRVANSMPGTYEQAPPTAHKLLAFLRYEGGSATYIAS